MDLKTGLKSTWPALNGVSRLTQLKWVRSKMQMEAQSSCSQIAAQAYTSLLYRGERGCWMAVQHIDDITCTWSNKENDRGCQ